LLLRRLKLHRIGVQLLLCSLQLQLRGLKLALRSLQPLSGLPLLRSFALPRRLELLLHRLVLLALLLTLQLRDLPLQRCLPLLRNAELLRSLASARELLLLRHSVRALRCFMLRGLALVPLRLALLLRSFELVQALHRSSELLAQAAHLLHTHEPTQLVTPPFCRPSCCPA
jgi:hypothetical protein